MASQAIGVDASFPSSRRHPAAWLVDRPALTAMAFAFALVAMNPVGFVGGGGDEYQYLIAARCMAEHGFCLPHDHWWRRWPIVAPSAAMLRLFGESYLTIALVPLAYMLASVGLLATVAARAFGQMAGTLAGVTFAGTPIVSEIALEMGIDMPEFLFALAAVAFVQHGWDRPSRRWPALAGLMTGLAIQARPTALTILPILVVLFIATDRRRWLAPFLLAAAGPNVAEALVYFGSAGDPLLGWKLSLAHVRVPSTELLPGVDTHQSPLFNPAYIGGWRRPMGIHLHWAVDGLLNYLVHPAVAVTLAGGLILLVLERRAVVRGDAGKALPLALLIAAIWFGALTYGFAIDPKPRMFLPTLAVACATFGALAVRRWSSSRILITAIFLLIVAKGLIASYERFGLQRYAAAAPAMIAGAGPSLSIDPRTARFLALVPAARSLPLVTGTPADRRMLLIGQASCSNAAREEGYDDWHPLARFVVPLEEPAVITSLRARRLFFSPGITPVMCVLGHRSAE